MDGSVYGVSTTAEEREATAGKGGRAYILFDFCIIGS